MNIINIGRQKPWMHFTDCRNMYRCFIGALIHSGLQRHSFFRILQQPVIGKGILFFAGQLIQQNRLSITACKVFHRSIDLPGIAGKALIIQSDNLKRQALLRFIKMPSLFIQKLLQLIAVGCG